MCFEALEASRRHPTGGRSAAISPGISPPFRLLNTGLNQAGGSKHFQNVVTDIDNVGFDRLEHVVRVAARQGVDDGQVLAMVGLGPLFDFALIDPGEVDVDIESLIHRDEACVFRSRHDVNVKRGVESLETFVIDIMIALERFWEIVRDPLHVPEGAALDRLRRQPTGVTLDRQARPKEIGDVIGVEPDHGNALFAAVPHQAVALKPAQRVPDGRGAHLQRFSDLTERQNGARREIASQDSTAKFGIDPPFEIAPIDF